VHCYLQYYLFSAVFWVDYFLMDHARKLVLVEPRMLEELQTHMEYKNLLKPADYKRKADLSVELQNVLSDTGSDDDDIKAKLYQQTFRRFRSMNNKIDKIDKNVFNPITAPLRRHQQQQQQQQPQQQQQATTPRSKRNRRKTQRWSPYN